MSAPNLVSLERVTKSYGVRVLLDEISLGVGEGMRIGVVGRNGDGKSTLLDLVAGRTEPDAGRVARNRGLRLGHLRQRDDFDADQSVRAIVVGGRADHEWAADPRTREVVEVLLADVPLDRAVHGLSGGERRRCALARLLLGDHDLLLLDEPTNHLDVEAVAWLAEHLAGRSSALVVVTHDRWFLDAVCEATWEVHDGVVDAYEGGYAAFVLAKAERQRQTAASEARRQNLVRKELAWLRRGAPARTSKPRFRVDAANALIAGEPPPRDRLELERFATQRLGKDVLDVEDVDLTRGERVLLRHATWRLGPGDRYGVVGINGAGKSTLLGLLAGEIGPDVGRVRRGRTVALAHLTQDVAPDALAEQGAQARVLPTLEALRRVTRTAAGRDVSASALLERFGFTGDRLTARIGDLSGGERRRFQLLRLLVSEPNVLLLDEPTNDLDIETLTVLEDFLDTWPGTLVVVSHDRYFLERVTDATWALLGDGQVSMLPGGVDQYLDHLHQPPPHQPHQPQPHQPQPEPQPHQPDNGRDVADLQPEPAEAAQIRSAAVPGAAPAKPGSAEERAARKTIARLDRRLERVAEEEQALHAAMATAQSDYVRLADLTADLARLAAEKEALEQEWLEAAAVLE